MQLERTPVLGITIAVLVLCLECVGLLAYKQARQERVAETSIKLAPPVAEEQLGWHAADVQRLAAEVRARDAERFNDMLIERRFTGCRYAVDR